MKTNKFLLLLISQVSWLMKFVGEAPSFWGFINGKPFCHFAVWPANDVILWHFSLADKEIPKSRVKLIDHISFCPFEQNHQDNMNEPGQLIGLGNWEGWDAQSFDPCRCNRSPYQGPGGVGKGKGHFKRNLKNHLVSRPYCILGEITVRGIQASWDILISFNCQWRWQEQWQHKKQCQLRWQWYPPKEMTQVITMAMTITNGNCLLSQLQSPMARRWRVSGTLLPCSPPSSQLRTRLGTFGQTV